MKKEKGVTLLALVITIIILLILAGVTISSLTGEDGIIKQAVKAKELTQASNEKEAISIVVLLNQTNGKKQYVISKPLYDKTIANGNIWNVITDRNTNKIYGTGWNYIEKGTQIDSYGKTQSNWIVNYDTGEIKELKENSYTELSYKSSLAVGDGLILNVDPTNMQDSNSWGDRCNIMWKRRR